jgi:hypothetical protein
MMKSPIRDSKLKSPDQNANKNLEKLIRFQKSKPVQQELKIAVIDSVTSPKNDLKNLKSPKSIDIKQKKNENFVKQSSKKPKPSDKFKVCSSDPFNLGKKNKSNFGYVYSAGGIPCRILHGNVKLKLKWDIEPSSIYR